VKKSRMLLTSFNKFPLACCSIFPHFLCRGVNVGDVMITSDYLQLRAFHAAVGIACGTRSTCACLPAAVR